MRAPSSLLFVATLTLVLATPTAANADNEVQVLRGRRTLSGLSGTGNGGEVDRLQISVDLLVQPLAYDKVVGVRSSLDDWKTSTDTNAYWVENFSDGSEHWRADIDGGTVGTNVVVGAGRGSLGPAWFRYAAFYTVSGATYWDNAQGRDHAVAVLAPQADPLPESRGHPTTVLVDDALYLVGGRSNESYELTIPNVQKLDDSGAWTQFAALPSLAMTAQPGQPSSPEVFSRVEAAAVSGKLYIAAGEQIHVGGWPLGTASLDLTTAQWTACACMPGPLFDRRAVATAAGYQLVPTTGDRASAGGDPTASAYVFDAASDTFSAHAVTGLALLTGNNGTSVVQGSKLYFFGVNGAFVYDPTSFTVSALAAPPITIGAGALSVALGSTEIAIANAAPDFNSNSSDLLVYDVLANAFTRLTNQPLFSYQESLSPVASVLVGSNNGASQMVAPFLVFTGTSRVDVCDPFAGVLAEGLARTTIHVQAPAGATSVTLRGSASPLSWDSGTIMTAGPNGEWTWSSVDVLDPTFRFKPLANDQRWFPGADLTLAPGSTMSVSGNW